ncbi:MAG: type II secretion system F family protein [Patescibacteria group bacterium]|nr:type II secretion system F family protein [Patescibacteria group bacterium]
MKFNYQARDQKGQTQVGVVEASSRESAFQLLGRSGLVVTVLEEAGARPIYARRITFFDKVSAKDLVLFSRQLAILFRSKVSLIEALQTIAKQAEHQTFREKIIRLSESVEGGTAFSDALGEYPKVFSSFYVNIVKSGEASGKLSDVLEYLADHLEREYELNSKIKGAMVYPAFVIFIAIAVLGLMMFFVIPNLSAVLMSTGQELPIVTKVVLGFASFLRSWGWIFILLLSGIGVMAFRYIRTPKGKRFMDKIILQIPMLNSFVRMIYLSRFAENLSTLVSGGLPIVQSLDITAKIIGNDVYKDIILEAKIGVSKGERIGQILERYPKEFPPVFTQMVIVGEKSGSLDTTLLNVVEFYRDEVVRTTDTFLSILEPALIVVLGGVVGGLMASILLPLYQLSSF